MPDTAKRPQPLDTPAQMITYIKQPRPPAGGNGLLADLVAYWPLGEASGNRASSVGSKDLSVVGSVSSAAGKLGSAATGFSVSNYLSRSADADMQFGGRDISGSCWVRFNSFGGNRTILSKFALANSGREVVVRYNNAAGKIELIWYASGGATDQRWIHAASISTGVFYHVAWGRDNTTGEIFLAVDGSIETRSTASSNSNTQPLTLGALTTSTIIDTLDGTIDELAIWHRALSPTDVAALYNAGAGRFFADFD